MYSDIAISWGVSGVHDWGVYGTNLVTQVLRQGRGGLILLGGADIGTLPAPFVREIVPFLEKGEAVAGQALGLADGERLVLNEACMLHSLGNGFSWNGATAKIEAKTNVGVAIIERANFDKDEVARANLFDLMIAGSSWNASIMRDQGVNNVHMVFQGVDTQHFRVMPRAGHFGDKFVVFSSGRLEFRKGQDIALAAFKAFRERHDDAILVTAWQNHWPESATGIQHAGHVAGAPEIGPDGALKISEWAQENGLPDGSFADLGFIRNEALPMFLSEVDVGVFTSRCEGNTNLSAMEAMSSGVPCILSANTGHLDLIDGDNCYPMRSQGEIYSPGGESEGWGETSVDEVVEALEQAYTDREDAKARGRKASADMKAWSWENRIGELLDVIERETGAVG